MSDHPESTGLDEQPSPESHHGPRSHEEDLALVRRALDRDPTALEALTQELARIPGIVRAKNRRMGSLLRPEEEADAAQEAMTAVWAKLESFKGASALSTWIYGFAATQVLKARQTKGRQRLMSDEGVLEAQPAPAPRENAPLDPTIIRAALEAIDPLQAEVIRLRHFEDLTFDAIAAHLDLNLSAVKSRYYRGMPKLQQALQSRWEDRL